MDILTDRTYWRTARQFQRMGWKLIANDDGWSIANGAMHIHSHNIIALLDVASRLAPQHEEWRA